MRARPAAIRSRAARSRLGRRERGAATVDAFFVPPSAVAASVAIVLIGLRLVPRALPGLQPTTAWLVLLVYLSNFAVASTTGLLYRATKPLVAPLLLVLLLLALAEHRRSRMGPRAAFAAVFATGLAMSLVDRQGLFYLLLFIPAAAAAWLRSRRGLALVLGAVAAAAAWAAYNWALGPWAIHALNGYWPETRFQRLRPAWLMRPEPWLEGARLLGDWARVLLGGIPRFAVGAVPAAAAAAWAWTRRRPPRGFQLLLVPHVNPGTNSMTMEIIPKETNLSGTGSSALAPAGFDVFTIGASGIEGSIALPRTRSSTILTSMLLESGQTAVIGGLTSESDVKTVSKVPGLAEIPVLAELFNYRKKDRQRRSLMVFVTPTLVRSSADTERLLQTELLRRRSQLKDEVNALVDPEFAASQGTH